MDPEISQEDISPQVDAPEAPPEPAGLDALLDSAIEKHPEYSDRDARGRFTSKSTPEDGPVATPEAEASPPAEKPAEPAEPTTVAEPASQPLEPPSRWSDADKASFAKLPDDAKQLVIERSKAMEADYTRKTQQVAEQQRAIEPLLQKVSPWIPYLNQRGIAASDAFEQLMNVEYTLNNGNPTQKRQALDYLAQLYGVELSSPAQEGDQPQQWVDPQVQSLSQQVQSLSQALQQVTRYNQNNEYRQAETEFASIGASLDPTGKPKFPHFAQVKDRMIKLVAEGDADTWETAYDMAIWANGELRSQMLTEREKAALEAAKQSTEKQRQEVAVAKAKVVAPIKTSHGVRGGATSKKGLDAILGGVIDKAGII